MNRRSRRVVFRAARNLSGHPPVSVWAGYPCCWPTSPFLTKYSTFPIFSKYYIYFTLILVNLSKIFISASNEPSSRARADIWRMPRGLNTPQQARSCPVACCGVFDFQSRHSFYLSCLKLNDTISVKICGYGNCRKTSLRYPS